jgi:hypothetical protein
MSQGKVKLWVGVGTYLLSGVAATTIACQNNAAQASKLQTVDAEVTVAAEGGEGGEGGEGEETKPSDPSPTPTPTDQSDGEKKPGNVPSPDSNKNS